MGEFLKMMKKGDFFGLGECFNLEFIFVENEFI